MRNTAAMVREKAARAFRDYSVAANPFSSTVDPRWEAVKAEANQALKDGDLDRAVAGYTNALKIADADEHVDELFAVLSQRPNGSVGHKLDAAKADLAPIIRKFVPGPNLSRGEPNQPAAICLANRAAVHLKAGRVVEAVGDARLAAIICPEYIKAHFRLRQALLAVGDRAEELEAALLPALMPIGSEWEAPSGPPTAASVEASLKRFEALSKPEPLDQHGRQPPGIWLGFRLVICFLLDPAVYFAVYEEPRTRAWRELARRVMENVLTPPACAYDYRYLRVHMEVFHVEGACPHDRFDYLGLGLNVVPPRPCLRASGPHPSSPRMANFLGEMEPPPLPSIDYRYIRLPSKLDEQDEQATGRMIAKALADVFERDEGLPMVTMVGVGAPLHVHADAVRDLFEARGLLAPRPGRDLDALVVLYTAGHPIKHRAFGYRGVILGTPDHTCMQGAQWIEQMGVDDLPRGRHQPWYHVLVDTRDRPTPQMCYVCHENISLWRDPPEDEGGALGGPIVHPHVQTHFTSYDKDARLYRTGSESAVPLE